MNRSFKITIQIFTIDEISTWFEADHSLLSPNELARANRFKFDHLRQRFISGRSWLRTVLGHVLGCKPDLLQFGDGQNGKPYLVEPNSNARFNFSRSHDYCVCAIIPGRKIGVDIEQNRQLKDMESTARTIFDQQDFHSWQNLPDDCRSEAFFRAWTKKEAVVKASGAGISAGVKTINVPVNSKPLERWHRIRTGDSEYLYTDITTDLNCPLSVAIEVQPSEQPMKESVSTEMLPAANNSECCLSSTQCIHCNVELRS